MSVRRFAPLVAALCALPGIAQADKLDKDAKAWLDQVRPIMQAEEERIYKELDKGERAEFQKIFWARRDPNLGTPANEYQAEFDKLRADADTKYKVGGRPGSQTDCGRVAILLGEPTETKVIEGGKRSWTFTDRAGLKFAGGKTDIEFDASCMLPQGARLGDQLYQVAEAKIAHPNLQYTKTSDGKLTKLVDQLPKDTPTQALLKSPRTDFPLTAQPAMFLRSPGGASYMAGMLKADAPGVTKLLVATQITDAAGGVTSTPEREAQVDATSGLVSFGMALKPGTYTAHVAAYDPATKKGSVATVPVTVPDFSGDELKFAPLMVLADIQEGQAASPTDPFAAFVLGTTRMIPRYDNVFQKTEELTILTVIYNPMLDPAGKPSITSSFVISKDGKQIAKSDDQTVDTPTATPSVGPVPLAKFSGKYTATMKLRDNVSKKDYTQDVAFEVK